MKNTSEVIGLRGKNYDSCFYVIQALRITGLKHVSEHMEDSDEGDVWRTAGRNYISLYVLVLDAMDSPYLLKFLLFYVNYV